jgi:hypothetical protein
MSGEEWHWLLGGPNRPTILYPSTRGVTLPQPIWCLRDGNEIVSVGWSESGVVQSIQRGDEIRVLVEWLEGDLAILFDGKATASHDSVAAQSWAKRLWTAVKKDIPFAYSPSRCDTVIRFQPCGGFQVCSEQVSHLREGFRDDSPVVLESKLLYNLNQMLQDAGFATVGSLENLDLIHARDLAPTTVGQTRLSVPSEFLVSRTGRGEFLRRIFCPGPSSPSWVNVRTFLVGGRPRLLRFHAQDPPGLDNPRCGGTMMMSWQSDLSIEFL